GGSEQADEEWRQRVHRIAHADYAAPAHQPDLRRFVAEPRRVGGENGGGEVGSAKRVGEIGADPARQRVGALAGKTGIGAIEEDGADLRLGAAEKALDPPRRDP